MKFLVVRAHERPVLRVLPNHDGDIFLSCSNDKTVRVFRTATGEQLMTLECGGAVNYIDLTYDSEYLVTATGNMRVSIWELWTRKKICDFDVGAVVKCAEWSTEPMNQRRLLVSRRGFQDVKPGFSVMKFDEKMGTLSEEFDFVDEGNTLLYAIWGAYDQTIICLYTDGTFVVLDAESKKELWRGGGVQKNLTNAALSKNRLLMTTTSDDFTCCTWDMVNREMVNTFVTDRPLNASALHPRFLSQQDTVNHIIIAGGQKAASVANKGGEAGFQVLIYHAIFEDLLGSIKGAYSPINCVAWLPDGNGFLAGAEEGNVRVYFFEEGDEYAKFEK